MKYRIFPVLTGLLLTGACSDKSSEDAIYHSDAYTIYRDGVIQGEYSAKVLSATEITSDYQSEANLNQDPKISFKFSINGKDNEMPSGQDHTFYVITREGVAQTPVLKFGELYTDKTDVPYGTILIPDTKLTVRVDMNHVFDAFKNQGYYVTANGNKIYREDFKGLYVAGNMPPMTWDFDNLVNHPALELKDEDGDGIYEVDLIINKTEDKKQIASAWKLSKDITMYPQFKSDYLISDAIYNLSIEEMTNLIEADSTLRTGEEWAGVWTRDVSYSIILSMAYMQPEVSKKSLLHKVKNGLIVQDTGTGGAYPVSTDRIIWATAAWQIYLVTGERAWLTEAYAIIRKTIEQDEQAAYDQGTGLVKGESSFLDWREQEYPRWMQPADIYESECLGTSAVHYQANVAASCMAEILGDHKNKARFEANASKIKDGINNDLWLDAKGYYGIYLYGRNHKILSPLSETLGESLSILFGIADEARSKRIISSVVQTPYGNSCLFPQIPNILPYHNNGIWPFVQSFWMWASAKAGNGKSVMESIASIYRAAALFTTNKENFVADNGDFAGTQINSGNMLWSIAGNISIVHKLFFGINFEEDKLVFKPFIPENLEGKKTLTNFRYRNAVLNMEIEGYGNQIKSFVLDGEESEPMISAGLTGRHDVVIVMANNKTEENKTTQKANYFSPETPLVKLSGSQLTWEAVKDAASYKILKDGRPVAVVEALQYPVKMTGLSSEYQVVATDANGYEGFASEPVQVSLPNAVIELDMTNFAPKANYPYKGFTGDGFVETTLTKNTKIHINPAIPESGLYAIDFRYANGNGPVNTENKCAVRTFSINNKQVGAFVFPHRGKDEWSNWGYSNSIVTELDKGRQNLELSYEWWNENMNIEQINQAMLDQIRIVRLK